MLTVFACGIVAFICVCSVAKTGCWIGYNRPNATILEYSSFPVEFSLPPFPISLFFSRGLDLCTILPTFLVFLKFSVVNKDIYICNLSQRLAAKAIPLNFEIRYKDRQ